MAPRLHGRLVTTALAVVIAAFAAGAPALAQDGEQPEIVWLEQDAGNPYWDAQHAAAAAAGDDLGFDFRAVSGNGDPASQAATLTQLVDQGVDAVMLNAIDPTATAPGVAYALDNDVPVISLYAIDPDASASVTFDEISVGETAAKNAAKII